ncbi:hypothetical protein [Metallosphaera hakonensis]|uniref:Uncharacterized protein n=1 Tax=Metallosphaera hakonensis JCM 8857 = DSM 7519 TaxID=1293036 RepID=A0A2U9IRQ1_9CREN|nr:hypothetical protein [Metallosphaera hakonensis]
MLEDNEVKMVRLNYETAQKIEDKLGRYGFLKGPKSYVELIFSYLEGDERLVTLSRLSKIEILS